jgi:ABC-2 type transport system ATP-binding protein
MKPLIELEELTKDFGQFRALDGVSVAIEPGITGLLGPNGAGKSTLIKVLLGLLQATSGRGEVLDFDIGRQGREIRSRVGYMPEDDCFLYGLTGAESVQLSAQLSGLPRVEGLRRAHEMLDFCGIAQERYRTVETYSTGMRQKLRFAQSVVHDPPLLILDEPTSGLDPEERDGMLRRIKRLAEDHGKAVLISTHILPDVQAVSDAVVILAQGRVRVAERLEALSRPAEPAVQVRLLDAPEAFLRRLAGAGLAAEAGENGTLVVRGPEPELTQQVWRVAREAGATIRRLSPARNSLEQIFLRAVQEQPGGSS